MVLAGIMLAQRRRRWPSITLGLDQFIVLSGVSGMLKRQQHNGAIRNAVQSPNGVLITGQQRRLWVNIETALECIGMPRVCTKHTTDS